MLMSQQEAQETIKACGWSVIMRTRKGKREYIYAARKVKGKREEVYVGSFGTLPNLTQDDLKRKLSCA